MNENESHNPLPVTASSAGSRLSISRTAAVVESSLAVADQKRLISQLSSPFIRQDIFYAGSITSLREYKTSQDMAAYVQVSVTFEFWSCVILSLYIVNAYKYFFSNRVCEIWYSLPHFVVEASSFDIFRRLLNQVDLSKFVVLQWLCLYYLLFSLCWAYVHVSGWYSPLCLVIMFIKLCFSLLLQRPMGLDPCLAGLYCGFP